MLKAKTRLSRRFVPVKAVALLAMVALAVLGLGGCQSAATYPAKPILFVVPYAPGGGSDIMARAIDRVATQIKAIPQPFVIENKAGGSSVVGKSYAREKGPDGYTIVVTDDGSTYVDLMGNTNWRASDFSFVAKMVIEYNLLVVKADSPYKTLQDLIKAAKDKPGQVNVAGTAIGGADQTQLAVFGKTTGTKFNYISVDSGGQVVTNVLGGQVDAGLNNPPEAYEQMRAGKLRALGISAPARITADPVFKDVPTWKESGVDVVISQWRGIAAPPGLKKEHSDWLIAAFKKVADSKEWKEDYLDKYQQTPAFVSGEALKKEVEQEYEAFKPLYQELGLYKAR